MAESHLDWGAVRGACKHRANGASFPGHSEPGSILHAMKYATSFPGWCHWWLLVWTHVFCGVCTGISGVEGLGKLILVEEGNPANALVCVWVCGCVGVWVYGCVCGGRGKEGGAKKGRKSGMGGEWREEKREEIREREEGKKKKGRKRRGRSSVLFCFERIAKLARLIPFPTLTPSPSSLPSHTACSAQTMRKAAMFLVTCWW